MVQQQYYLLDRHHILPDPASYCLSTNTDSIRSNSVLFGQRCVCQLARLASTVGTSRSLIMSSFSVARACVADQRCAHTRPGRLTGPVPLFIAASSALSSFSVCIGVRISIKSDLVSPMM